MIIACVLDIGGTHTSLALARLMGHTPELFLKQQIATPHSSSQLKHQLQKYLEIAKMQVHEPIRGCAVAVAGNIENNKVTLSHHKLDIDQKKITKWGKFDHTFLLNDFAAVGLSTNIILEDEYDVLQKGKHIEGTPKAVLGVGTGLGKSILALEKDYYYPLRSEGGHSLMPYIDEIDTGLYAFMKQTTGNVCQEDFLSGLGIERIYTYLQKKEFTQSPVHLTAKEIMNSVKTNPCSKKTKELFSTVLGKVAQSLALDTLPQNGLYFYGGVLIKNPELLDDTFLKAFRTHPTFGKLLKTIPMYSITTYYAGLLGAAYGLQLPQR